MTDYAVGIDSGSGQDSKTITEICSYLQQCGGGTVINLGIGPNRVQSFGLSAASQGKTAVYIANGVGLDTPEDLQVGISRGYYHYNHCIFVWPQWIGNQYMSDENISGHSVPREHDFTSAQMGVAGQTAAQYFPATKNVSLVAGKSTQEVAQKICSGNFVGEKGNSSSGQGQSNVSPLLTGDMTFEQLMGEICNGIDLMFLVKRSTVVITDFETIYAEAKYLRDNYASSIEGENIKLWQLEDESYNLEINHHGFYNTVYVEYKDGKVKESYEDLVQVFGEVAITYKDPTVDKTTAIMKAKAYLAAHLRDMDLVVNGTILTEPDIDIGDIITLDNPLTMKDRVKKAKGEDPEYLFVSGINTSWEGDTAIMSDIECKLAPVSPEKLGVPTSGNGDGTSGSGSSSSSGKFNTCGVSEDKKQIMAIGLPSAVGESKYGYTFYKSVFQNKCPFCGEEGTLVWDWNWGTVSSCTGTVEGGTAEGHIFCAQKLGGCDADFSCIDGKDHMTPPRATLTRVSGPESSSKEEATQLKNGLMN